MLLISYSLPLEKEYPKRKQPRPSVPRKRLIRRRRRRRKSRVIRLVKRLLFLSSLCIIGILAWNYLKQKDAIEIFSKSFREFRQPPSNVQTVTRSDLPDDTLLIMVNKAYPLGKDYVPTQLTDIADEVPCSKPELSITEEAADQYKIMIDAMKKDGLSDLYAISGYRTYTYQKTLYDLQVDGNLKKNYGLEQAEEEAAKVVMPPGSSEHQTGLAIDVSAAEVSYELEESFENTEHFSWLQANSYLYGFILRYPKDKTDNTSIIYEPWHYRYVGMEHAKAMFEHGFCLEEYIEWLGITPADYLQ